VNKQFQGRQDLFELLAKNSFNATEKELESIEQIVLGYAASECQTSVLIRKCTEWSRDRKILENGNTRTQCLKLVSEIGELADNIAKGRDCKDDIGDCLVVLNNLAQMTGTTLHECLQVAYDDIKDRRGVMNHLGVFVKEADF
jgi:hypothetical protein